MLSKLQARLTFANVVSLIALVAAIGFGTAWALERNSVKSRHIAPNQVRASDTSDRLRLECSGRTRYFEGACIETSTHSADDFLDARGFCSARAGRLPSYDELLGFRLEPGITLTTGAEWTLNEEFVGTTNMVWVVADNGSTGVDTIDPSDARAFRCVRPAKR